MSFFLLFKIIDHFNAIHCIIDVKGFIFRLVCFLSSDSSINISITSFSSWALLVPKLPAVECPIGTQTQIKLKTTNIRYEARASVSRKPNPSKK
ncbi:MAG: hypothetical protein U9N49_04735 [Campylobacterota bacterium]|nr:hypothetical protein [Campylobacterota bacterium]